MLNAIRQAALTAIEAAGPVAVMFGTVTSVDPLEVNVDQRFTLTEDFLIVPERLIHYEVDLMHSHKYEDQSGTVTDIKTTQPALPEKIVIRKRLEVGERVLLLRVQGGQKFVVFDRVVEA